MSWNLILPPIRALVRRLPGVAVHPDPYAGPFAAYHQAVTEALTWDLPAILAAVADRPGPVLDVGCGGGRVTRALAAAGHAVTAIDGSEPALAPLRADRDLAARVEIRCADVTAAGAVEPGGYGAAVIGDLSVNMFAEPAAAGAVLTAMRRALRPGGAVCFPVLRAAALPAFESMRGMTAVPFRDPDGRERLLWLVLGHDPAGPFFRRTLFLQDGNGPDGALRGHVTAVCERLWTPETLAPPLAAAGLTVVDLVDLATPGGPGRAPLPAALLVAERRPPA